MIKILRSLPSVIAGSGAVFAGGTFCSMMCGEYRRSDDVDFLCADPDGYRNLRQVLNKDSFSGIPVIKMNLNDMAMARVAAKRFLAEFREIARPRESPSI